ncbi:MAG: hypothetical protein Q7T01_01470 [bacterium]|nr:hypothetical protein [bacterium]
MEHSPEQRPSSAAALMLLSFVLLWVVYCAVAYVIHMLFPTPRVLLSAWFLVGGVCCITASATILDTFIQIVKDEHHRAPQATEDLDGS